LEELQNYFNSRADYLRHHFNYIVDKEPQWCTISIRYGNEKAGFN
jgi:hypothetical protein